MTAFATDATSAATADPAWGQLPLVFEENLGQTDPAVRFLARGRGYTLFLTPEETVLRLPPGAEGVAPTVVRMQLEGGATGALMVGVNELEGHSHYLALLGDRQPVRNVPRFRRVRCAGFTPAST